MTRPRGFSLIEMMVAITLALIVSAGVLSIFAGTRTAFQATSGTAAIADSGRFALNFIQNSLRNAGYMACNTAARTTTILSPGPTPLYFNFGEGLGGFEANATGVGSAYVVAAAPVAADANRGDWMSNLDGTSNLDPALAGLVVANNDVLVVRSTLKNAQSVYVAAITDGAPSFNVNTQGLLATGQVAVISDCYKSVAFQISSISGSSPSVLVDHSSGGSPGNSTASFGSMSFAPGSQVTPVDTIVYYIGRGADGDGALWSYDLGATNTFTANELVPDIEAMQILYGVDTTGTQTVSQYVTANQVTDFNTVMSVKVAVLAASAPGAVPRPQTAATYNLLGMSVTAPVDSRYRQVFESTTALRNVLP